ncbi:MAG: LamG domain-containing protein, partial [Phycisphaerales bacterium]
DNLTFIGEQGWTVYWHAAGLTPGTTYYWRVDEKEADGTVHEGDVWRFSAPPSTAFSPNPSDGEKWIDVQADLSWTKGFSAESHDVYFGTDESAVASRDPSVFMVNQPTATFEPGTLAQGTTYYWAIDELDATTTYPGSVWKFTTMPVFAVADPNLVCWWKLDEGAGTVVVDYSGCDHHGSFRADPEWAAGYDGGALDLDGLGDYVDFGNPQDLPSSTAARSMCGWAKTDTIAGGWRWIAAYGTGATSSAMFIGMNDADLYGGGYGDDILRAGFWEIGAWHHICLTYDGATARLYADGVQVVSGAKSWNLSLSRVHIGRMVSNDIEFWDGIVDDVRIYSKVLTQAEIMQAMRGDPLLAWDPSPANSSTVDIEGASTLTWKAGDLAVQHDVYFGTERDAVAGADTSDTTGVYQGRLGVTGYIASTEKGKTYYWRIDENNNDGSVSTGRVWSFTVAEYLIVDDFEDYNDYSPDRIFQTWIDGFGYTEPPPGQTGNGTGSTVGHLAAPFAEQTTVHGGGQSMPFGYDNSGTGGKARYSEAEREFLFAQDFTGTGVKALVLYIYGDPGNAPATLYVGLQDSTGTRIDVPETDTTLVTTGRWREVNIELS